MDNQEAVLYVCREKQTVYSNKFTRDLGHYFFEISGMVYV